MLELLEDEAIDRAVQFGLAFRLGAVLAGSTPGVLSGCPMSRSRGRLKLTLRGHAAQLAGEEVEKRMGHLANELGLDPVVSLKPGFN